MKHLIKYLLQSLFGYNNYLYVFAEYKIRTLRKDEKESDFFLFLNEIKGDGDLLDVGANIGIMTYHLAKHFPSKRIIAIEPIPSSSDISKRIKKNHNLSNVEILGCAAGEHEEDLEMLLPIDGKVRMQGLAHVVHDSIEEWNEGEKIEVRSRKIDGIVGKRRIAGIKMDIENYEYFALKGAQEVLKRDHPVLYLELWENKNRNRCFELLENLGYRMFVNQENTLIPYQKEKHRHQNFIFKVDSSDLPVSPRRLR